MKNLSFTTKINLDLNRNHYQGYVLASNLRHIMNSLLTRIICRKNLISSILLTVEHFKFKFLFEDTWIFLNIKMIKIINNYFYIITNFMFHRYNVDIYFHWIKYNLNLIFEYNFGPMQIVKIIITYYKTLMLFKNIYCNRVDSKI